jgi:hypothetical protein
MNKAEKRARSGFRAAWLSSFALVGAIAALCGCDVVPIKQTADDPLNFTADDNNKDCTYEYSPSGLASDPEFELSYGAGMIVSASYYGTYEGPPGSLEISYGTSTTTEFSSGLLDVFSSPDQIKVTETRPTSWSLEINPSGGGSYSLPYGHTWSLKFSCGATPSCCADTPKVDVAAYGVP